MFFPSTGIPSQSHHICSTAAAQKTSEIRGLYDPTRQMNTERQKERKKTNFRDLEDPQEKLECPEIPELELSDPREIL